MKKSLAVGCAVAFALALSACSSQAGGNTSQIGEPGDPSISGTVTFWHAYSADSKEIAVLRDTIIPAFEDQYPDVTVEDVAIPFDELHKKLVTGVAGGSLPDLIRSDLAWVPELASLDALVPLSVEMPDYQDIADAAYPGMVATTAWQGEYYGLPLDTNTRVMMYNEEALNEAGVAVPSTIDEVVEIAPALAEAGIFVFADNGAGGWNMLPWIWSAGGDITDPEVTKATGYLNSAETVAAVQTIVDLYEAGGIPDIMLGDSGGLATSDGLVAGTYATILDGPWMWPIFETQYPEFTLNASLMPAGAGGSVSVVGGEDIVLTSASDNKAAAAEFMRFLTDDWAQLEFAKVGQMSAMAALAPQIVELNPNLQIFTEQLETARARPATPAWAQMETILQDNVRAAMRGDMTVQDALDDAAAQMDALLAKYTK